MPNQTADANLLFGIIALQMDFVTRDQLLDAMQDWTLEKSKHLGDILVERQSLREERRELLDALVNERLKDNDHDPEKSLRSISSGNTVESLLSELHDTDVQESLRNISTDDRYATQVAAPVESTETGQRYRILRPHAEGGLGRVSVALDKELHREVALKELHLKFAGSQENRDRFLLEAEVTGGLEHPNIVPVYGLGKYADGRPFYAMRLIHGDNLQEAIAKMHSPKSRDQSLATRNLAMRRMLQRFIDVCDAIQYAHSRGVLHRDLKPDNIMLGKYGETLVVDWGLAKTVDREPPAHSEGPPISLSPSADSTATRMGTVVGTPAYMAPEQASGRLDLVGPTSDVYGLGATLYHLLTGEPPFKEKGTDVVRKVERGEIVPPRERNRSVPAPLEAICLKAMSLQQNDRYKSAFHLAEDVENWLGDEPVTACLDPVAVRLGRWARRHRTLVTSTVVALGVALVFLGGSLLAVNSAYKREQQSYAQARGTVDQFFTQVSENALLKQPGLQPLRIGLLKRASEHYEQFVALHAADASAKSELAKTWFRLGLIREATATPQDSLAAFEKAAALQRDLSAKSPSESQLKYDIGLTQTAIGRILSALGETKKAIAVFEEAAKVRESLAKAEPENAEYSRTLANSYMNLGMLQLKQDQVDAGKAMLLKSQELRNSLLAKDGDNKELQRDLGKGNYNLANLEWNNGNTEKAEKLFASTVSHVGKLVVDSPRDFELQEMLAVSYRRIGDIKRDVNPAAAIEAYNSALQISENLATQNKSVHSFRATHATILNNLAGLHAMTDLMESHTYYESAHQILENLVGNKTNVSYANDLAVTKVNLAQTKLWLEQAKDAEPLLLKALEYYKAQAKPDGVEEELKVAKVQRMLSRCAIAQEDWSTGLTLLQQMQSSLAQLFEKSPDDDDLIGRLEESNVELQAVCRQLLALDEAGAEVDGDDLNRAREIRQKIAAESEGIAPPLQDLAMRLRDIGRLQWASDHLTTAIVAFEAADDCWKEQSQTHEPNESDVISRSILHGDLAASLLELGEQQLAAGEIEKSVAALRRAETMLEVLVGENPDDEFYQRDLQRVQEVRAQAVAEQTVSSSEPEDSTKE